MPSAERDPWELARPFFDVTPHDVVPSRGTMSRRGPLIVSDVHFGATTFDHDPAALREFDNEYLMFERYRHGSNRGLAGDTPSRLDAQSMHVIDMSKRYRTTTTTVTGLGVIIPHHVIGYDPGSHPSYVRLSASSPRGRVLDAALAALADQSDSADDEDVLALADSFSSLVSRLMLQAFEDRPPEELERGNWGILCHFIEGHLTDADLGVERLCSEFAVSRATLYRLFKDYGGVRRYVVDRKLDRCFADLAGGPYRRGRVHEVAERWGFFDGTQFVRSFRSRFGITPSSCLELSQASTVQPDRRVGSHPIRTWMRHL